MIKIEFKDGKEPLEIDAKTIYDAVQYAVKNRLDLRWADLSGADLSGADLREADLRFADLIGANFTGANLICANLRRSDFRGADLKDANLTGANVDFSSWPLDCGSLKAKIDKRIFCQLLYHTLKAGQSVDDPGVKRLFEIPEVVNMANKFHRVDDCGKIELKGSGNATLHN